MRHIAGNFDGVMAQFRYQGYLSHSTDLSSC